MAYNVWQYSEHELPYCFPFLTLPHDLCFLPLLSHTPTVFSRDSLFCFWVNFLCSSQRSCISILVPTACLFESQRFLKAKIDNWIEKYRTTISQLHILLTISVRDGFFQRKSFFFPHSCTLKYTNLCSLFNTNNNWCFNSIAAVINASLTMDLNAFLRIK